MNKSHFTLPFAQLNSKQIELFWLVPAKVRDPPSWKLWKEKRAKLYLKMTDVGFFS